ncbi:hypothetical protein BKA56DRAFT_624828 [Ilyonectria sp. MPI-CAGE-AT-0026]|nr:hypothetical protein BKA56DRAFT_624828 [Ilyonectria sp. MPI-CAGE-AT-0026]
MARFPTTLLTDDEIGFGINDEDDATVMRPDTFAIDFGCSIPFTEVPPCIARGMELTYDLYVSSHAKVLAHYENARNCLEKALGDPLCNLLLIIVSTFTSSTASPTLPRNKDNLEPGPRRNRHLLAVTLMTKML